MGLWDSFQDEGHSPCHGNRSVWGSPHPIETDFVCDPDGHGWHVDRARFDLWLRGVAVERGATLMAPGQLESIDWDGDCWRARVVVADGPIELIARVAIDAGGTSIPGWPCSRRAPPPRRQACLQLALRKGEANPSRSGLHLC